MKNLFSYFALCLTVAFGLALSSCGGNCSGVECGTHGACDETDGACKCDTGYETDANGKCETLTSAKFIGTWTSGEICTPAVDNNPYTITIAAVSGDLTKVRITNFGRTNCGTDPLAVTATISGTTLKDYATTCTAVTNLTGTASLSADGKTLNVTYGMTDGTGTTYNCTAAMVKN